MSTNQRIRGRKLQVIRERHKRINPLCPDCEAEGVIREWEELDHDIPLGQGGTDTDDNRVGRCKEHHRQKTLREFGLTDRKPNKIGADGWPT